jgi:hypothetical protein
VVLGTMKKYFGYIPTMSYTEVFKIAIRSSQRFEGREPANPADISKLDVLFRDFTTDVVVGSRYQFIVDSFPFLHEVLSHVYQLHRSANFVLIVGEGLEIRGEKQADESFQVQIVNCDTRMSEVNMTASQLLLAFSCMGSDLARSIALAGIDVYQSLKRFPVDLP